MAGTTFRLDIDYVISPLLHDVLATADAPDIPYALRILCSNISFNFDADSSVKLSIILLTKKSSFAYINE